MKIKDLLLKKEEIPILYENCFQVPIHPKFFDKNIRLNPRLANQLFPKAAEDWYNDLKKYVSTVEDKSTKGWIKRVFLKEKPKITERYGGHIIDSLNWEDRVITLENGFAHDLMINRNFGGSLYFNGDNNCNALINYGFKLGYIRFSEEKGREFSYETIKGDNNKDFGKARVYGAHNVDNYPGALFLRNWAIIYLNEAMKQVLK